MLYNESTEEDQNRYRICLIPLGRWNLGPVHFGVSRTDASIISRLLGVHPNRQEWNHEPSISSSRYHRRRFGR